MLQLTVEFFNHSVWLCSSKAIGHRTNTCAGAVR
jgi:hypothetical protein